MNGVSFPTRSPRDPGSATVLVSHPSPLICAGVVAALQRMPWCDVSVCDATLGPWQSPALLAGVDVLVADAALLPHRPPTEGADPRSDATTAPRLVLITTHPPEAGLPAATWQGVGAFLSMQSKAQDVVDAVRRVIGDRVPRNHRPAHVTDPGTATTVAHTLPRPRGGLPPGALRKVREHVESHLAEKIELCELAAIAGLSQCHFSRAFKQSMGMPPHRYLMARRIANAAELIDKTDQMMTEISLGVGFSDQSHFTRVFLAMMGETPGAFRRRHR